MESRCPAWCDRILFNESTKNLFNFNDLIDNSSDFYNMIGQNATMGDHKVNFFINI